MTKKNKKNISNKIFSFIKKKDNVKKLALSFIIVLFLFFSFFGVNSIVYAKKVYNNQFIGDISFSGKTREETKNILLDRTNEYLNKDIKLIFLDNNKEYSIKPQDIALSFDVEKTTDEIWNYGRNSNQLADFWIQLRSLFRKNYHKMVFSVNEESLSKKIAEIAEENDIKGKDFEIVYKEEKFVLNSERSEGKAVNQDELKNNIKKQISIVDSRNISFNSESEKPKVSEESALKKLSEANQILEKGDLVLTYENQKYSADKDTIGGFIKSRISGSDLELYIDNERLKIFVESIAKSINIEPKNAKLGMENGKAVIKQKAQEGKTLDQSKTETDIENALFSRIEGMAVKSDSKVIILTVNVTEPEINDSKLDDLGIKELIGTGKTSFWGSPKNRVHNIEVGAAAINGKLLKPGDEFSTLNQLGKIDASSGYLEELVIKENRTVPEFGGGLCQVSSTLFRAALNAGMEITERQNHKYRVSYYEPPVGMDATIYDPAPDFKFKNNYKSHVLIQSEVVGNTITFYFFGTKDGRKVEVGEPEIYDIVEPSEPVMIETDTLPAGEKKQIERAHQGASAKFHYKVSKDDKILQEKDFVSKYVPWPEKWLVGKGEAKQDDSVLPQTPTCNDSVKNGDETGVDCGGSCSNKCD